MIDNKRPFDPFITYVSGGLTLAFVAFSIIFAKEMDELIPAAFKWTTHSLGKLYLLSVFGMTVTCFILMLGPWGKKKLGMPDSVPEYTNLTWFGMLFGSAIAAGIAFWGPAEPIYHYQTVPPFFTAEAQTPPAAVAAMTQSFFHWGLSAWAIYVTLAIPMAHASFTKNLPLRFSTAFYYILGDKIFGLPGKIIDIFAVIATMGGLATTTGLTALQVISGLKYEFGLNIGPWGGYIIIALFTAIFTFAVFTGLQKGVKIMNQINLFLFVGVFLFIFLLGPKMFFMELGLKAGGKYILDFIPLSLFTNSGDDNAWLSAWTIFYWAWWMSWAPFVSVFVARVSKGRSIRQLVMACMLLPSLANFLWYTVIGGAGIYFNISDILQNQGLEAAIFGLIQHYPFPVIMGVVILALIAMLFLTSANSAAVSLAMFVSGQEHPHRLLSAFWAIALGAVAMVLCGAGNLKNIQTASILSAVPMIFLLIMAQISAFKGIRN